MPPSMAFWLLLLRPLFLLLQLSSLPPAWAKPHPRPIANLSISSSSSSSSGVQQRSIFIYPDPDIQQGNKIVFDNPHPRSFDYPNPKMFYYQFKTDVANGDEFKMNDAYRDRLIVNALAELRLQTCLEPRLRPDDGNEWVGDSSAATRPYVNIRTKFSPFYQHKKYADRCASTYLYKRDDPGKGFDHEVENDELEGRIRWAVIETSDKDLNSRMPDTVYHLTGKILHEFFHALGFIHEHQRPDRHKHVFLPNSQIGTLKQCPEDEACFRPEYYDDQQDTDMDKNGGRRENRNYPKRFRIIPGGQIDTFAQPYDYGSIMHFGPLSFQQNVPESVRAGMFNSTTLLQDVEDITHDDILTVNKLYANTIGQRKNPSFLDIKRVNLRYCPGICDHINPPCHNGGYLNPSVYQSFELNNDKDDTKGSDIPPRIVPQVKSPCHFCICPDGFDKATSCKTISKNPVGNDKKDYLKYFQACDSESAVLFLGDPEPKKVPGGNILVDAVENKRGKIAFPPEYKSNNDPWSFWEWKEPNGGRKEAISCYWKIEPKHAYEKVVVRISQLNFPCMSPCQSYVEIKYKRDKGLTGPRFCCSVETNSPTVDKEAKVGQQHHGNKVLTEEEKERWVEQNKIADIVADNGVPVVVIFRLAAPSDYVESVEKYGRPGFSLHFAAIDASEQLAYDLSYHEQKNFLPRNARHQLDPENPLLEGVIANPRPK